MSAHTTILRLTEARLFKQVVVEKMTQHHDSHSEWSGWDLTVEHDIAFAKIGGRAYRPHTCH